VINDFGSVPQRVIPCSCKSITPPKDPTFSDKAIAVKVAAKRLPVSPFSGLLKGCQGDKTHRFENGGTNQIRKTGKREVVLLQPLPQSLYPENSRDVLECLPEFSDPTLARIFRTAIFPKKSGNETRDLKPETWHPRPET
jgi:hypothetical protein